MEIFRQSIQGSMDGQYPPLFRIKVPSERQVPKVYLLNRDTNGKETWKAGALSDISRGSYAVPIVECTGVWFEWTQIRLYVYVFVIGYESKIKWYPIGVD